VNLRRLSIVLLLFAGGLMLFTLWVQNQKARRGDTQDPAATRPAEGESAPATQEATDAPPGADSPGGPTVRHTPEEPRPEARAAGSDESLRIYAARYPARSVPIGSLRPAEGYTFQVSLSTRGAGVSTVKLAKDFATVADKRRWQSDPDTYEEALREDPEKYKGRYILLNPVGTGQIPEHLSMATGMLRVQIEGESRPVRGVDLAKLEWAEVVPPEADLEGEDSASFEILLHCGQSAGTASPLLRIIKTYTVRKADYSIQMTLGFENLSTKSLTVSVDQSGPTGIHKEGFREDLRQAAYARLLSVEKQVQARLQKVKDIKDVPPGQKTWIGRSDEKDPVLWVGYVNKFFGSMMYLRPALEDRLEAPSYRGRFYLAGGKEYDGLPTYLTGVEIPELIVSGGKTRTLAFDVFAGPKKRSVFSDEDDEHFKQIYKDLGYIETIDLKACFCTFAWLALAMMELLEVFSKVALGNYGVAIIILVFLVRLILHPLTKKSQVSMMRMQKLAPQIQKLKEKYADDKNALNKEMMKVYKEQGASPLLGCLPMLLQMPIWIALYTGLRCAYELRHASFLPFWITDLAAPDALFVFSRPLPLIGTTFNLLPILLGIAMFLQSKYGPGSAQAATGSDQAQQTQKMMKYMMPAMMLFIFYNMPSGLNLYIMASTFAGLIDQYLVRKHIRQKEAVEAMRQTTVRVPGKASRNARPKKPKGPTWVKHG